MVMKLGEDGPAAICKRDQTHFCFILRVKVLRQGARNRHIVRTFKYLRLTNKLITWDKIGG